MPTTAVMAPLHSSGEENQNEVQHDFTDHVTPLVLASCDADHVTMAPLYCLGQDNQMRCNMTFLVM